MAKARAGRKRKVAATRTKSGQISRAGKADPRAVVLAQPHRAGRVSEWRGTVVGRFLEDDRTHLMGASRKVLHDAADRLLKAHVAYQAAIASRRPLAVTGGVSQGPEDIERTLRAEAAYTAVSSALAREGEPIRQATLTIICDYRDESYVMPFHVAYHLTAGLKALAEHYGLDWRGEDRKAA